MLNRHLEFYYNFFKIARINLYDQNFHHLKRMFFYKWFLNSDSEYTGDADLQILFYRVLFVSDPQ